MIEIKRGKWGSKSFKSTELFQKWLESERDFYQPLMSGMPNAAQQFQYFQHAINSLTAAHSQPDNSQAHIDQARSYAETIYSDKSWTLPPSDSSDGKLIKSFERAPPLKAKVAHQLGSPTQIGSDDTVASVIVAAYHYPKLVGADGFTFAKAPANTLRELEKQIGKADALVKEVREGQEALFQAMHQESLRQISDSEKAAKAQIDDARNQWNALKNTYDAELALQAPRTYWQRQKEAHQQAALDAKSQFRTVSIFSVMIACGLLGTLWTTSLSRPGDVPITTWVLSGVVLAFAFWVVRLFSRLFLSREHLARDAEERVTMIETYLALSQHGRVKEDDLKLVLGPIFRPTEDGLVKDDSLPSPMLDLFQQGKK
jgi:Family of unknown function (DUF6161)